MKVINHVLSSIIIVITEPCFYSFLNSSARVDVSIGKRAHVIPQPQMASMVVSAPEMTPSPVPGVSKRVSVMAFFVGQKIDLVSVSKS